MRHRERIQMYHEGKDEEIVIWNFLNVNPAYQFRGGNPTMETFKELCQIEIGGGGKKPEYITNWVAEELWHELHLDNLEETHGIEVIDMDSDQLQRI